MRSRTRCAALTLFVSAFWVIPVQASTIVVGVGAFGPGSTLTTFTGLPDGTEVNGLVVDGIQFSYSLGNGQVIIDGGPGVTNNIAPPNIVSIGNDSGVLRLILPSPVDTFGYGYAILAGVPVIATEIALFSGTTFVGDELYTGAPDPFFIGGFAGIQSTIPFNIIQLQFNSAAPAFAVDNIRTFDSANSSAAVPEPSTMLLLGTGMALLWFHRRVHRGSIRSSQPGHFRHDFCVKAAHEHLHDD
jgi:PEP-CTERM motif